MFFRENEAMWQQVSHLRNQHVKQQHIVNKLVQFLVALVQPSQKRLGKRNLLAIDEVFLILSLLCGFLRRLMSNNYNSNPRF